MSTEEAIFCVEVDKSGPELVTLIEEAFLLEKFVRQHLKLKVEKVMRANVLKLLGFVYLSPYVFDVGFDDLSNDFLIIRSVIKVSQHKEKQFLGILLISEEFHVHFEYYSEKAQV
jgi:hypothetical protein